MKTNGKQRFFTFPMPYLGTRWHRLTPSGSQLSRNWLQGRRSWPQVGPSGTQVGPMLVPSWLQERKTPNRTNKGVVGSSRETNIVILSSGWGSKKWYFWMQNGVGRSSKMCLLPRRGSLFSKKHEKIMHVAENWTRKP